MANQQISRYDAGVDTLYGSALGDARDIEQSLMRSGSESYIQGEVDRRVGETMTMNDVARGILERRQSAVGAKISDRQLKAQNKRLALAGSAAVAGTATRARDNLQERARRDSLFGSMLDSYYEDIQLGAYGTAAQLEHRRNIAKQADKGNSFAGMMGGVATLAGMGVGFAIGGPAGAAYGAGVGLA